MPTTYELPKLPYALNALEPSISGQIMDLHYNRHHKTYVSNLNNSLASLAEAVASNNLIKQLELQAAINFNAGGHVNHTLFWESLAPASSGLNDPAKSAPTLHKAITAQWGGNLDAFKAAFETAALAIQGSGWQWLVQDPVSKSLELVTSKDQDLPGSSAVKGGGASGAPKKIIFGVDMWEHAYYLQYFNNKKEYLTKIWDVINWQTAEKRYTAHEREAVFGALAHLTGNL